MTPVDDHPRRRFSLEGVDGQCAAFEDSLRRGRLHHAWLLTGPEGLGKASFAYRAARRLLGAVADNAFGALGSSPADPVCRMISARSHPDLLVLERDGDAARKVIPVDEARRLSGFFAKAPALGPYRVAIIDAVDDFNANGANAVLKTLEEPTGQGVLFLVSHAPGRLLPTIRSRCRMLAFRRWTDQAVASVLSSEAGSDDLDTARIASMAKGSPGRAMTLMRAESTNLDQMAEDIVASPEAANAGLLGLADSFRGGEGGERFALFVDRLASAAERRAHQSRGASAARWSELWSRLSAAPGRVDGLNLDRADAFWSIVRDVAATARG